MTIYDLLYVMDNQPFDIAIHNDAYIDNGKDLIIKGDIYDIKDSDSYDDFQYEDVTDIYTESDGTIHICFYNDEF